MKKKLLGIVCMMAAVAGMAEQMTLTGTLTFDAARKYYTLKGCTPELAAAIKGDMFTNINMAAIASGDQVKITLDGAKVRPDGKVSTWGSTVISVEKAE